VSEIISPSIAAIVARLWSSLARLYVQHSRGQFSRRCRDR